MKTLKAYPSDVSDEEWSFVVPYLALVREDSEQRRHELREVFNALRWLIRSGAPWRMLPNDLAWAARFRRLARDYERMPHTLAGFRFLAFACRMLPKKSSTSFI